MTLDTRWKHPPGATPDQLYRWAQDLINELRKGQSVPGSAEEAQDAVGSILLDTTDIDFTYDDGTPSISALVKANAVTYAKMQDISATSRILGRKTAAAGDTEECTLSEVLDFIGSAAQGDLLYRGASAWARLGAGTSGQFLQTQGTGANPQWASSSSDFVLLTSGTVSSAASLDIVLTGYTSYRGLRFLLSGFLPVTDAVELYLRFSTNGGSTYETTSYNHSSSSWFDNATQQLQGASATSQIILNRANAAGHFSNVSSHGGNTIVDMLNQASTAFFPRVTFNTTLFGESDFGVCTYGGGMREVAEDCDAVRFLFSSGNISAGNYAVYGYK